MQGPPPPSSNTPPSVGSAETPSGSVALQERPAAQSGEQQQEQGFFRDADKATDKLAGNPPSWQQLASSNLQVVLAADHQAKAEVLPSVQMNFEEVPVQSPTQPPAGEAAQPSQVVAQLEQQANGTSFTSEAPSEEDVPVQSADVETPAQTPGTTSSDTEFVPMDVRDPARQEAPIPLGEKLGGEVVKLTRQEYQQILAGLKNARDKISMLEQQVPQAPSTMEQGLKENALVKAREFAARIEAVRAGTPLNANDKQQVAALGKENVLRSLTHNFQLIAGKDYDTWRQDRDAAVRQVQTQIAEAVRDMQLPQDTPEASKVAAVQQVSLERWRAFILANPENRDIADEFRNAQGLELMNQVLQTIESEEAKAQQAPDNKAGQPANPNTQPSPDAQNQKPADPNAQPANQETKNKPATPEAKNSLGLTGKDVVAQLDGLSYDHFLKIGMIQAKPDDYARIASESKIIIDGIKAKFGSLDSLTPAQIVEYWNAIGLNSESAKHQKALCIQQLEAHVKEYDELRKRDDDPAKRRKAQILDELPHLVNQGKTYENLEAAFTDGSIQKLLEPSANNPIDPQVKDNLLGVFKARSQDEMYDRLADAIGATHNMTDKEKQKLLDDVEKKKPLWLIITELFASAVLAEVKQVGGEVDQSIK